MAHGRDFLDVLGVDEVGCAVAATEDKNVLRGVDQVGIAHGHHQAGLATSLNAWSAQVHLHLSRCGLNHASFCSYELY